MLLPAEEESEDGDGIKYIFVADDNAPDECEHGGWLPCTSPEGDTILKLQPQPDFVDALSTLVADDECVRRSHSTPPPNPPSLPASLTLEPLTLASFLPSPIGCE